MHPFTLASSRDSPQRGQRRLERFGVVIAQR
jgi:hypothetical protein